MQEIEAYGVVTPWMQGKSFNLSVGEGMLESNPKWSDLKLSPPVKVEEAIDLATQVVLNLVSTPVQVQSAKVQRLKASGNWIWLIEFGAREQGTWRTVTVAVLMNGSAIAPRLVEDDKSFVIE